MVLLINRLFFRDPVSGRNWLGVAFSTLGVMILLFQGNPLHAASLHTFAIGDLWAMGSALSWALYCSLLRLKDRRIPANGFVAVSSLLGALIPGANRHLLADAPPGAGLGSPARAVFPQRPRRIW